MSVQFDLTCPSCGQQHSAITHTQVKDQSYMPATGNLLICAHCHTTLTFNEDGKTAHVSTEQELQDYEKRQPGILEHLAKSREAAKIAFGTAQPFFVGETKANETGTCPCCKKETQFFTVLGFPDIAGKPEPLGVRICLNCQAILVYDFQLKIQAMSKDTVIEWEEENPGRFQMVRVTQEVLKKFSQIKRNPLTKIKKDQRN